MCKKYNAHINVELCASVKSIKYLYKYVYKGHDCANVQLTLNVETPIATTASTSSTTTLAKVLDEIQEHLNTRFVSAPEATWRLFEFKMYDSTCSIIRLAVHLEQQQVVYFQPGKEQEAIDKVEDKRTHLTAWFELNQRDSNAKQYLYRQIPNHYTYKDNVWSKRKNGVDDSVIGRIYSVGIREGDRYYLRLNIILIAFIDFIHISKC